MSPSKYYQKFKNFLQIVLLLCLNIFVKCEHTFPISLKVI